MGTQPAWRVAALLAALTIGCLLSAGLVMELRPRPIRSHNDQVAFVLRERRIAYSQIVLGERWPDHINFQYGSNVFPYGFRITVRMPDGTQRMGWLECAKFERDCTLSISDLNIRHVELPDLVPEPRMPWRSWLRRYLSI